jgi:hypothetical protein
MATFGETFREMAKEVLQQARDKERVRVARAFKDRFGVEPDSVDILAGRIVKDDVTVAFSLWSNYDAAGYQFFLVDKCPDCGALCLSRQVHNLADLALQLESFKPETVATPEGGRHLCPIGKTI